MSGTRAICVVTAALCLLYSAATAETVQIQLSTPGNHELWFANPADRHIQPVAAISTSGQAVELEITDEQRAQTLSVHNLTSGTVATKEVGLILAEGSWNVVPEDFDSIYRVQVRVIDSGGSVESGAVRLMTSAGESTRLVSLENGGAVEFFNVPIGSMRVQVLYQVGTEDFSTPVQTFNLEQDLETAREFTIDLNTEPVPEADPTEPEATASGEAGEADEAAPEGTTFLGMLVGLVVLGGIGVVAYWFFFKYPQKEEMLKKAGLLTPDGTPDAHTPSGTGTSTPNAPKPAEKIVIEGAEPQRIGAGGAAAAPTTAHLTPNPRLTSKDGSVHMIPDDIIEAGRDDSCGIALVGEDSVSRRHARIIRTEEGQTIIEDLGSTNGTFVNGEKIAQPTKVLPGDTVQFGQLVLTYEE